MKPRARRILHRLFFAVVALTTFVVLFYAEEDWRGARAWAAAKRELLAKGESLDFRDFIPPPVPDDQNLAMAPLFARVFQYTVDPGTHVLTFNHGTEWYKSDAYKRMQEPPWGKDRPDALLPSGRDRIDWSTAHKTDLSALQQHYRRYAEFPHPAQPGSPADDVLLALTRFKPLLDELAQAATERPEMRFPYNWTQQPIWNISLPAYATIQGLTTTLRLRASAELASGQAAAARRDVSLMLQLRRAMIHDPCLIAPLVDATCIGILMQPLWEGLAARQWSAEDLESLRDGLRRIDMLRAYQQAIRSERAFFIAQLPDDLQDWSRAREIAKVLPPMNGDSLFSSNSLSAWLWPALPYWPRGWYAQNAAVGSRYLQEYGVDTVDAANHRLSLAKLREIDSALKKIPVTPGTLLAQVTLPIYSNLAYKFAQTQAIVDQASTACALEKYFLDHHGYPAALSVLVPDYLERVPNDVIDGAPMRYRLTVDGRYQLWSIGRDGQDDGGAIAWPPERTWRRADAGLPAGQTKKFPSPARTEGDWVWQYAPAEPPDPPANWSRLESLSP